MTKLHERPLITHKETCSIFWYGFAHVSRISMVKLLEVRKVTGMVCAAPSFKATMKLDRNLTMSSKRLASSRRSKRRRPYRQLNRQLRKRLRTRKRKAN